MPPCPSYVRFGYLAVVLAACGGATPGPVAPSTSPPLAAGSAAPAVHHLNDPDLQHEEPRKLLAIDWAHVSLTSDADALALWRQIAPTGDDWDRKLEEIPTDQPVARALAVALLRDGRFACTAPPPLTHNCQPVPLDLPAPGPAATLDDPCLRRMLALWAFGQIEEPDLPRVHDSLRAIAALPLPESELVVAAINAGSDQDDRFELIGIAAAAGQTEVANRLAGAFDEPHLIRAATLLHVAGALEVLSVEGERSTYLAAITDEHMATDARVQAIGDVVAASDVLAPDARAALARASKSNSCAVAARADRALVQRGDKAAAPTRPSSRSEAVMMRGLCVLASYERLQTSDEPSLFPGYVAAHGLERVTTTYDALSDSDPDGDGDPHTASTVDLIAKSELVIPDIDEVVRAMRHCTGTTCTSNDRELHFTWKPTGPGGTLQLARLAIVERPPCADRLANPRP